MIRAGILTISDSRSAGIRADTTTTLIRQTLEAASMTVTHAALVPDEQHRIREALMEMADRLRLNVIVTTGGTGLSPRDVTPEATRSVIEREVPGLAEALRSTTAPAQPLAWLSRGIAGVRGRTLVVNLPGSPRAVDECLRVLMPLVPHAMEMLEGQAHGD